jgi:hypothetical protein
MAWLSPKVQVEETNVQAIDVRAVVYPAFPPDAVNLKPAVPEPEANEELSILLMVWSFLVDFGDLFGLEVCSLDDLWTAVNDGETSGLLGNMHCRLLKGLLYDAEEAHRIMAAMTVQQVSMQIYQGSR